MARVKAHSWTGQVVDSKSNKFYRVYNVGPYVVTQYSSQSNGRTGGTFDFARLGSEVGAKADAQAMRRKKSAYETVQEIDFEVDIDKLMERLVFGDKKGGEFLDNMHTAAAAGQSLDVNTGLAAANVRHKQEKTGNLSTVPGSPDATKPTPAATGADRLTSFGDRALVALTQSTTDVAAAANAYAELCGELEELQDEFNKAASFLGTLKLMVTEALLK